MENTSDKEISRQGRKNNKIRQTIAMIVATVLLMSSATYAWFTLNSTARLTQLTMTTVGQTGGLLISEDAINWKEEITISDDAALHSSKFYPATVKNDLTLTELADIELATNENKDRMKSLQIFRPIYTNAQVTSLQKYNFENEGYKFVGGNTTTPNGKYYYYEKVIYMKITGNESEVICLEKAGSELKEAKNKNATKAVRIALTAKYKKNTNDSNEYKTKILASNAQLEGLDKTSSADVIDNADILYGGNIENTDYFNSLVFINELNESPEQNRVFEEVPRNTIIPIVIQMWFEGTDKDCVNEIMDDLFEGNLVFVAR